MIKKTHDKLFYCSMALLVISLSYTAIVYYPAIKSFHQQTTLKIQLQNSEKAYNNNKKTIKKLLLTISNSPSLARLHLVINKKLTAAKRTHQLIAMIKKYHLQLQTLTPNKQNNGRHITLSLTGDYQSTRELLHAIIYQPPFVWLQSLTMSASNQRCKTNLEVLIDHD